MKFVGRSVDGERMEILELEGKVRLGSYSALLESRYTCMLP